MKGNLRSTSFYYPHSLSKLKVIIKYSSYSALCRFLRKQVGTGARSEKIRTYNYKVIHGSRALLWKLDGFCFAYDVWKLQDSRV